MKYKKPIKSLKPCIREDKRYLFLEGKNLKQEVEKSILSFIGVLGMSKTSLTWIKGNEKYAVISINREMLDLIKACFDVWPSKIEVHKVSGTLKALGVKVD